MSFTVATAITRLTGSGVNAFPAAFTSGQQLQRINEVIDRFFEFGTWRGLHDTISTTSTAGVITLSSTYQRLDALAVPALAMDVPIRSMQWAFSTGGPGNQDWSLYGNLVAIDKGDVGGVRKYQLTGDPTTLDAMTFSALARQRFTWITNTATVVVFDSYQALKLGVEALHWEDEGDKVKYDSIFQQALSALNGSLQEFSPEMKQVVIQPSFGLRRFSATH